MTRQNSSRLSLVSQTNELTVLRAKLYDSEKRLREEKAQNAKLKKQCQQKDAAICELRNELMNTCSKAQIDTLVSTIKEQKGVIDYTKDNYEAAK